MKDRIGRTRYIARMGLLFALLAALSFAESRICAAFPIGVRIGLANIVVMFALVNLSTGSAFTLAVLKSLFVLLTRGVTASLMSLCGGIFSLCVMLALYRKKNPTMMLMSVGGGIAHNIAQLAVAALMTTSTAALWYAPVLVISGICAGICTGLCLGAVMPAAKKLNKKADENTV